MSIRTELKLTQDKGKMGTRFGTVAWGWGGFNSYKEHLHSAGAWQHDGKGNRATLVVGVHALQLLTAKQMRPFTDVASATQAALRS